MARRKPPVKQRARSSPKRKKKLAPRAQPKPPKAPKAITEGKAAKAASPAVEMCHVCGEPKGQVCKGHYTGTRSDPYAPKGGDQLLKCKKCKIWSARKNYCSNCKEER